MPEWLITVLFFLSPVIIGISLGKYLNYRYYRDKSNSGGERIMETPKIWRSADGVDYSGDKIVVVTASNNLIKSLIALLTIAGCIMQLFGISWFAHLEVFKIILFTIGSVSLFIGSYYWVKLKNLTWFYSFLGLLNFIGLLVIGLLHSKATTNINRVKQDKLVLFVALSVIGFVLLVILLASITGNLEHPVISSRPSFRVESGWGVINSYGELAIKPAWFNNWVLLPTLGFFILTGAITTSLYIWKHISSKDESNNKS